MNIQTELLKRYQYLNNNKELILAQCIIYKNNEKKLEELREIASNVLKESDKHDEAFIDLMNHIMNLDETPFKKPQPYLSATPSKEYIDMLEEFILGDLEIEDTELYNVIENIKNNKEELSRYNNMIEELEERREKNPHTKKMPAFTVWKILSYVRERYEDNSTVTFALQKYYNLERYVLFDDDSIYGYYVAESHHGVPFDKYPNASTFGSFNGSCVEKVYRGNEYEKEDKYFDTIYGKRLNKCYYPTTFANELAETELIENKKEVLQIDKKVRIRQL